LLFLLSLLSYSIADLFYFIFASGAFSNVYKAIDVDSGKKVAGELPIDAFVGPWRD